MDKWVYSKFKCLNCIPILTENIIILEIVYIFLLECLDSIQGSVESSFPVHVLSVSSLHGHMYLPVIISSHFLILTRVESSKSHDFHHLYFLIGFAFKIFFCQYWRLSR